MAIINGTTAADILYGTAFADEIKGFAGIAFEIDVAASGPFTAADFNFY